MASRTNNITGVSVPVCGLSTPTGAGTLEWNSTTQRFRFAAAGDSFGAAVGVSAANNILQRNVISGAGGNSYIVIDVTPGSLPSGTVTDTITIASGRKDTQYNVADVRISNSMLRFKGGVDPPGTTVSSYSTSFPLTETVLSEGGNWVDGRSLGGSWHNVSTTPGLAFCESTVSGFTDGLAVLTTSFTSNQFAQGTVHRVAGYNPGTNHEIELLLRFSLSNGNAHGYEILWGWDGVAPERGQKPIPGCPVVQILLGAASVKVCARLLFL